MLYSKYLFKMADFYFILCIRLQVAYSEYYV